MRAASASLAVMALWLAACADGSGSAPPSEPAVAPPAATSSAGAERLFGRIAEIDRALPTVTIELAAFFSLPEAIEAARADGIIGLTEQLPNPFYIRDLHERSTLRLDTSAVVTVLAWDPDGALAPRIIGLEEFAAALPHGPASSAWAVSGYYWFDVESGAVTAIEAQYLP